jgi:hypothetical protein
MNDVTVQAFIDELAAMEKEASIGSAIGAAGKWVAKRPQLAAQWAKRAPGAAVDWVKGGPKAVAGWAKDQPRQFAEAGKRLLHPVESMRAGVRHMTPGKQLAHMKATGASAEEIAKYTQGMGRHITEGTASGAGRLQRIADAASRAGWSGKGDISKYVPLWSQKGMYAGFGGLSAKNVYDAAQKDPTRTGSGGLFETGLGEGLGNAAMIAGTGGLGLLPVSAMMLGAQYFGGKAGRTVDRLRGGANLRTAALAPTPEEASGMIDNLQNQPPEEQQKTIEELQRYYG